MRNLLTEKDNRIRVSKEDANLLWRLMPEWLREEPVDGMSPLFYGTASYESDVNLREKVKEILFKENV